MVTPPAAGATAPRWGADGSVWSLIAANVLTLAVAFHQDWTVLSLMTVYWLQSVIIGMFNVMRILNLDRFTTENLTINDRPVPPTVGAKIEIAGFFGAHYGLFHLVYMVFLASEFEGETMFSTSLKLCAAAFFVNHFWSYRYNRNIDRQGTPNIGTLMFTPYMRVIPMHVMIIVGGFRTESIFGLMLFGVLKTVADVGMHLVEHAQLKKVRVTGKIDLEQ